MVDKNLLISVRNGFKIYRMGGETVYALRDISVEIYQGEYVSIMGPSGSGKSTLFNMIGALDKPTSGEVEVGGVSLPALTPSQLSYFRSKHIGYVFQSYNLIQSLTALDNVKLPVTFLGHDDDFATERALEVLDFVGLGDRVGHHPLELSGGQQQRVAIARALANDPTILLADEPTANLDSKTGAMCIDIFKRLSTERGVTVVSATHDHKMLRNSDRIFWIKAGEVEKIDNVADMNIKVGTVAGEEL